MRDQNCGNCRFSLGHEDANHLVDCHRFPSSQVKDKHDWCGEWQEVQSAQEAAKREAVATPKLEASLLERARRQQLVGYSERELMAELSRRWNKEGGR